MKLRLSLIIGPILISLLGVQIATAAILCIGGGGLSITSVPSNINFGTIEVSTSDVPLPITFNDPIYFEDMRGIFMPKATPRFSLYMTVTDLVDSATGETIDLTNISVATDENDTIEIEACSPQTQVTPLLTDLTAFTDSDDDGTSDNVILLTGQDPMALVASPLSPTGEKEIRNIEKILEGRWRDKWIRFLNTYVGKYSFQPEMETTIPAYTASGSYETTITFTII